MKSPDKDLRFMATNDFVAELAKESFKLDADSEKKLTTQVLRLVEDKSSQVQELAVKWFFFHFFLKKFTKICRSSHTNSQTKQIELKNSLGPLSRRVKEPQIQEIVDTLSAHLVNTKKGAEELRDISGIGLKTVITEISAENQALSSVITSRLTPCRISNLGNISPPLVRFRSESVPI